MRGCPKWCARIAAALVALSLAAGPARADPESAEEASQKADELFRQGKNLVKDGNLEAARQAYLQSWQRKRGYDIAGNLGNVELALGDARGAAEHLSWCIKNFPATGSAKQLESARERLAEARRRTGAARIRVNVDGAEVLVDGESVGRSPLPDEVFINPGKRVAAAKLAGYEPAWTTVEVPAGKTAEVYLVLAPTLQKPVVLLAPPVPPKPLPSPPAPKPRRSFAPIAVGMAVIGLGVGVGAGASIVSAASSQAAQKIRDGLKHFGMSACNDAAPVYEVNKEACAELGRLQSAGATSRSAAIVSFSVAGAALVASVAYALVPVRAPQKPALRPAFGIGPRGGSIGFEGRF